MSGFIPGPWLVHDDGKTTLTIYAPWSDHVTPARSGAGSNLGIHIAEIHHQNENDCVSKYQALFNAHLMEAAPEMYEVIGSMCRNALELGHCKSSDCYGCKAAAVMKKARGDA